MELKNGRYALGEVLGQGRFGTTFQGLDRGLNGSASIPVAVKVVPLGLDLHEG